MLNVAIGILNVTFTHTHTCSAYAECHVEEKVTAGNAYFKHIDFSILLTGTAIPRRPDHTTVLLHFILNKYNIFYFVLYMCRRDDSINSLFH